MSDRILEQFSSIPDPQAAAAFSEFYYRMGEFKVATQTVDEAGEFPPVPAWYTAVGAPLI